MYFLLKMVIFHPAMLGNTRGEKKSSPMGHMGLKTHVSPPRFRLTIMTCAVETSTTGSKPLVPWTLYQSTRACD